MISGITGVICLCFILLTGFKAQKFTNRAEANTPPIGEFIDVDGTQVHYVKKGTGPALILLHGAGGNLKDYDYDLIPELSKRYTVYAFDRPGHGYTDKLPSDGATLQQQSDLLHKATQRLGIKEAHIIGYSFGGALALNWALEKPDFIKGLVLVSSVSMPWPGEVHLNYRIMSKPVIGPAVMAAATAYLSDDYFRSSYASIFAPHPAPDAFMDHIGVNMSVRYKSFVENSRQLTDMRPQIVEQSKRYPSLKMPITLIHGIDDTSVPLQIHSQEFVKIVPQAMLQTIAGMGHAALQLAPKDVIQAIDIMIAAE
ncbi:alpha/beta hydrolase [Amylibacter sp. SFDW26]|uniref:alpha/beta fold hydrolase n=1 Tax=Amylibacter sp. SFDW26 TaxID=2652722 RepID=UPI0012627C2B|nr:alpha/beta hydrolase [Amylibacter sp. SFDW26]KAB7615576.1 alpha/beta hydrolase [Amylibacter sp. SFDW26]